MKDTEESERQSHPRRNGHAGRLLSAAGAFLFCLAAIHRCPAEVIYQENFDGGTANLAGTAPTVAVGGGIWAGDTDFKDDGSVSGGGGGVYLPFSVEAGYEYTLSVSFVRISGTWVAAGFSGGDPTSANRISENQGRGWGLAQSAKVQAFRGPNTTGVTTLDTVSTTNQTTTQTIILDATSSAFADWTFTVSMQVGDSFYQPFTARNAGFTSPNDITAIGLSTSGATANYTNLTLTKGSAVPEPAMAAPAGVAVLLMLAASRCRKMWCR